MKSELIMNSDVLDILFENKNKDYGAYNLRKYYGNRLYRSLGIMTGIVVILTAFSFIPKKKKTEEGTITTIPYVIPVAPEKKKEDEKPKEEVKQQPKRAQQAVLQNPKIVKDTEKTDTLTKAPVIDNPGSHNIKGDPIPSGDSVSTGNTGGNTPGKDTVAKAPVVVVNKDIPVEADILPQYPGGEKALRRFLEQNLRDPKEEGTTEKVTVRMKFIVGYDGKLRGFELLQDGGELYNAEVKRVLMKMKDWIPGKTRGGENVTTWYSIPVVFTPSE